MTDENDDQRPPISRETAHPDSPSERVVLWSEGAWHCEYWTIAGVGFLRLYEGDRLIAWAPSHGGEADSQQLSRWRAAVREPDVDHGRLREIG